MHCITFMYRIHLTFNFTTVLKKQQRLVTPYCGPYKQRIPKQVTDTPVPPADASGQRAFLSLMILRDD
jgi:hypothetical protein